MNKGIERRIFLQRSGLTAILSLWAPGVFATVATTTAGEVQMKQVSGGYAEVNGIKLYHEIYGSGEPVVLIHGGLTTIGEMQEWVKQLAKTRRVIAVEMQGHGHTADTDRPLSFATLGDDIAALLDHLKIPKADVIGHSFGGATAIRAAIQHPDKVRRLVVISSPSVEKLNGLSVSAV